MRDQQNPDRYPSLTTALSSLLSWTNTAHLAVYPDTSPQPIRVTQPRRMIIADQLLRASGVTRVLVGCMPKLGDLGRLDLTTYINTCMLDRVR